MVPSAHTLRTGLLDPALDGLSHNARQQQIVFDPSAEVDSIVEHLAALRRSATPAQLAHVAALGQHVAALLKSNEAEGACERAIAGQADQLAHGLEDAERNDRAHVVWSVQTVARAIRDPLADLCNPAITGKRERLARQAVLATCASVPSDVLRSVRLRHELSVAKFTRLQELLDEGGRR